MTQKKTTRDKMEWAMRRWCEKNQGETLNK